MVFAATGIVILLVSVIGATLWARCSPPDRPRVLLFFLYFWVIALLLLMLAAVVYAVFTK